MSTLEEFKILQEINDEYPELCKTKVYNCNHLDLSQDDIKKKM
jgi:hypothetical protein